MFIREDIYAVGKGFNNPLSKSAPEASPGVLSGMSRTGIRQYLTLYQIQNYSK